MRLVFLFFKILVSTSLISSTEAAMIPFGFWKPKCSPPFASSWTPRWSNIIQYWNLNGSTGSIADGATIPATIGSAGTATETGMSYVTGKIGNGVSFNGGNYIDMGSLANTLNRPQMSIAAWIYPTANSRSTIAGAEFLLKIQFTDTYTVRVLASKDGSSWAGIIESTATYPLNQWLHMVATYNGSQLVLYANGVSVGSTPMTGNLSASGSSFQISGYDGLNEMFTGTIDDVAVWNVGLTADEVTRIYTGQNCKP